MSAIHIVKMKVKQLASGPLREVEVDGLGEVFKFGTHGGYEKYYKNRSTYPLPTAFDAIIAAVSS